MSNSGLVNVINIEPPVKVRLLELSISCLNNVNYNIMKIIIS